MTHKGGDGPATYKKWEWNKETNTLEQKNTGLQPLNDKQLNHFKIKKSTTNCHHSINKPKKATTSTVTKLPSPLSTRRSSEPSNTEYVITLNDVKKVTLRVMGDDGYEFSEQFKSTLMNQLLDDLLSIMLHYFQAFFEKVDLEAGREIEKFEMSWAEKKTHMAVVQRIEASQKFMSRSYCVLILGLDTEKRHHMACGKSRKSTTKQDREFYENLYAFCCVCVWITFSRKR